MKKLTVLLLCAVLVTSILVGCAGERSEEKITPTKTPDGEIAQFVAQAVRTDGGNADIKYPQITLVRSLEELTYYYDTYKDVFNLDAGENSAEDSTIGYLDAVKKYNADYFQSGKVLMMVVIEEPVDSGKLEVTGVVVNGSGLDVSMSREKDGSGETMAQWTLILELSKADYGAGKVNIDIK